MNRIGRLALVAGILAIALAVPIAAANVIFVYQASVTVKPVTPIVWMNGSPMRSGLSTSSLLTAAIRRYRSLYP